MDDENMSEPENILNSEADEEINPNDSDDGKRFDNHSDEAGFIGSFCQLEGNDYFVEIDPEFIDKKSNLFGIINNYKNYE
jgi:hypothetical protein